MVTSIDNVPLIVEHDVLGRVTEFDSHKRCDNLSKCIHLRLVIKHLDGAKNDILDHTIAKALASYFHMEVHLEAPLDSQGVDSLFNREGGLWHV